MIPFIQEPVEEYDLVSYCRRLPAYAPRSQRKIRLRLTAVGYPAYALRP